MNKTININQPPLVVDLDGTLIKSDLLYEGIILLLKKNPLYIFLVFLWLLKGKLYVKKEIFNRTKIDPELLPYNHAFLDFLNAEYKKGRKIVLATASLLEYAIQISKYLNIFSEVYGSENETNLKGKSKRDLLVKVFGDKNFDYAGNSKSDLVIFKSARKSILVNPNKIFGTRVKRKVALEYIFENKTNKLILFLESIRIYQWSKNLLVFVPLFTSQHWDDARSFGHIIITFLALGLIASSGYIINDLFDLGSDRSHPRKKKRPLASGEISIQNSMTIAVTFLIMGFGLSAYIGNSLILFLLLYLTLTVSYSIYFKTIVLVDVFFLASLYTMRIIIGASVINVVISFWLLAFSVFIFFSLALVKRYAEVKLNASTKEDTVKGRGYSISDLSFIGQIGISSGLIGVVVFALYIDSPEVKIYYTNATYLWLICLMLLYWISFIWHTAFRGNMTDDPIIYSFKSPKSLVVFFIIAVIFVLAL